MRILHVIYDDLDNPWVGGGGATRTYEIYRRAVAAGHQVTIVCGNYPGAPLARRRMGVLYRHVGSPRSYILSRLTYSVGAARLIKRGGYDIVIEDVSPFSPVGAPLWSAPSPSVASVQNLSGSHAVRKYGLLGLGPRVVEKPLLSLFRNFVAVSPGIAAQIRRSVQEAKICVVPNSAGLQGSPTREGARAIETWRKRSYVLFLGRVDVYQKGLDRLIRAFDMVAGDRPTLDLLIAGGGTESQMRSLRALVERSRHKDRVRILGQVDRNEADELLRHAVLLAMPSRYEAWPLTAIEAAAVGLPVVGSDIVGVRDAAPKYPVAHGCLVPEGDLDALATAMRRLATDAALRKELGKQGRRWATRFTWDALAARQLAFYEQVVKEKRET